MTEPDDKYIDNRQSTPTRYAEIDYGCGMARMWAPVEEAEIKSAFYHLANQCFGIRKSITDYRLIETSLESLPAPWGKIDGATSMLKHSGDTIVWDAVGEKIKSEWD